MPCLAAAAGPVPLGACTWRTWNNEAEDFGSAELTTREVV
jgi:hypothetical protein